jgi:hypothetical protein
MVFVPSRNILQRNITLVLGDLCSQKAEENGGIMLEQSGSATVVNFYVEFIQPK